MANSWSIFGKAGKQLVSVWQTVGPSSAMLANSWVVFGNVGKQLGSHLNLEISHTEQGTLINAFEHSAWREEQNVSDFAAFFSRASKIVAFWEFAFVSSTLIFNNNHLNRVRVSVNVNTPDH